jgi:hypothetical protein
MEQHRYTLLSSLLNGVHPEEGLLRDLFQEGVDKGELKQEEITYLTFQALSLGRMNLARFFLSWSWSGLNGFRHFKQNEVKTGRDNHGNSMLHWAARYRDASMCEWLLARGADPNAVNDKGQAPLHFVNSRHGDADSETTHALIKAGADRSLKDKDGNSPDDLWGKDKVKHEATSRSVTAELRAATAAAVSATASAGHNKAGRRGSHAKAAASPSPSMMMRRIEAKELVMDEVNVMSNGRFGGVHRGTLDGSQPVAVKVFDVLLDKKAPRAFPEAVDARISRVAELAHGCPFLVPCLGVRLDFASEGRDIEPLIALAMPMFDTDLGRYRATHSEMPVDSVLQTLMCVAKGLAAVHAAGLAHSEVTPSNILVRTAAGSHPPVLVSAALTDFGVSGMICHALSKRYEVHPDPRWLAPEVLAELVPGDDGKGSQDLATAASDVYSFGHIAWFLRTGLPPFTAAPPPLKIDVAHPLTVKDALSHSDHQPALSDIKKKVLEEDRRPAYPAPPSGESASDWSFIAELSRRCWAKKPIDRPTIDTIVKAIEHKSFSF